MLEAQRPAAGAGARRRQIQRARGQESGDVSELAHRRAEVKREFDRAYGRVLEETGEGRAFELAPRGAQGAPVCPLCKSRHTPARMRRKPLIYREKDSKMCGWIVPLSSSFWARACHWREIGRRFGSHESTVSYWARKHGLEACNAQRHAAKGGLEREELARLAAAGMSIAEIAQAVQRSKATVRYWLGHHGVKTAAQRGLQRRTRRRRRRPAAGRRSFESAPSTA